jgi:tetratricopeptide (TPR) repeat protein
MLGASAFFAYKIYEHIQTLQDPQEGNDGSQTQSHQDRDGLLEEGDAKMQEGDFAKALAIYSEANYKNKGDAEILFKMGYALAQQKRYDEAIERYKEALEIENSNTYIHQALASAYRAIGEYTLARQHIQHAIDLDPNNPINYYNYGNLLVDMAAYGDAKEMYEKAITLDSDFKEAYEELEKLKGKVL